MTELSGIIYDSRIGNIEKNDVKTRRHFFAIFIYPAMQKPTHHLQLLKIEPTIYHLLTAWRTNKYDAKKQN